MNAKKLHRILEYNNHLTNVLTVSTDKKLYNPTAQSYSAQIVSASDYYPFGWAMPKRTYSSSNYRFGYQGSEKNEELNSGSYTTEFRQLDTRIGRWLSIDPLWGEYPGMSPYVSMGNNPIVINDVNGDSIPTKFFNDQGEQIFTIPDIVKSIFMQEYGIELGYNAETEMLYVKSQNINKGAYEQSEMGSKEIASYLGETNSDVNLYFGYDLYKDRLAIVFGLHSDETNTAYIDLNDFDAKGNVAHYLRYTYREPHLSFDIRTFNLARTFEHEWWGHGVMKAGDHSRMPYDRPELGLTSIYNNWELVNVVFREPIGLPSRFQYNAAIMGKLIMDRSQMATFWDIEGLPNRNELRLVYYTSFRDKKGKVYMMYPRFKGEHLYKKGKNVKK